MQPSLQALWIRRASAVGSALALMSAGWAGAQTAKPAAVDYQARLWASSCMACHGTDGKAEGTGLTISGRRADELLTLLLAFKRDKAPATVMHQHAKGYGDDELRRIALYFSQVK